MTNGVDPEGDSGDEWAGSFRDAEPVPVGEEGGAGVFGVGGDAVEGEELAEVGGESSDGFCGGEFRKLEGDGVVEDGGAGAGGRGEKCG